MKRFIVLISFIIFSFAGYAKCTILCDVRYFHKVYHPPAYYEGNTIGKVPIAGTDYYEDVWSDTYTVDVTFYSGYEFNDQSYPDKAIIAVIQWSNGGYSTIQIKGWVTRLKYMTYEEARYDSHGNALTSENGYDTKNYLWEITFDR